MESAVINIALITNDAERVKFVKSNLKKVHTAISRFSFEDIFSARIGSDPYDIILLDYPTCSSLELKEIFSLRKEKLLEHIPFLFILDKDQKGNRDEIFKDNLSGFLSEPFDQFEFLQQVKNLVSLASSAVFSYFSATK